MGYNKLLEKQIKRYLGENADLEKFIAAVNNSYNGFDRDIHLSDHAFKISEREYKEINENLAKESKLKQLSLSKLKETLREIDENKELNISESSDDLLDIANYLQNIIAKRKEVEENLAKTAEILTTLVSNLNSGIVMEDENRKILYINQTFCDLFFIKTKPEELIGTDYCVIDEHITSLIKYQERYLFRIQSIINEKKKAIGDEFELTDGRYLERNYIPLMVGQQFKGNQWNFNDITIRKNNDHKLKENRKELQRLSLVASANTNGVLLTDPSGRIFWSNESYLEMTDYSMDELIDKRPIDVARGPKSDGSQIRNMIKAYALGKSFTIEVAYYRKNGSWFWGRVKGQPILDPEQNVIQYFSIIEDISQEKARDEQIKRLSLVASANSKGVFFLNNDITIAWANTAYESITGYTQDELKDKNPVHLFFNEQTDPAIIARMREKDTKGEDFTEEFLHKKKDGSVFWARLNMQFVTDDAGKISQRFGVLDDITKEKDAEQAVRIREEKYRSIIANMNLGLLEVDNNEIIQYANQSFMNMSGFSDAELIGNKPSDFFISGENIEVIKSKNEQRTQGISDAYEIPVRDKKGDLRYWLISGAPRYNDKGEIIGSIGIHLDVTKQKLQELELIEARKKAEGASEAKETFLANMSHEIRTPLNAIIGMLRELSKETVNNKQRAYLNNANAASRHLLSIINNILDISKIEAGEFQLEKRHISMVDVINETVSIISSNAEEKLIDIQTSFAADLKPALIGDPVRIRQILINLLGNSIKFTEKGYIHIECTIKKTSHYEQYVQISIMDTGIGMDKAFLKDLFKKFSQENKSTAIKYGGTGLGMAITYQLVQLMGGSIEISSEKGKGTQVDLLLPMPIGNINEIEKSVDTDNFNELRGLKVLLAEDNELNRIVAINTLSYFGLQTTEAENGLIAIEKLKNNHFDVILMDLHMPEMDGLQATRVIRQELKSDIPIIALTANAFKKEIEQCLEAGMNDFVTKPFEESVLLQSLLKHVLHKSYTQKSSSQPSETEAPVDKLYDLSRLIDISRGDTEFIEKMISLFIDQAALSMQQIKEAFEKKDYVTVGETAHRIKASIGNLGITYIKQDIADLEHIALQDPSPTRMQLLIEKIDIVLLEVIEQLKQENA